ncbi:MAG: hypothetical protein K2Q06_02590 [Parvularculaceae bacterium]|nr:hypothetical protein [Parvularculaceae bacterium]
MSSFVRLALKQPLVNLAALLAAAVIAAPANAESAGAVALGDSLGGVIDRAYVSAPPEFAYVLERAAGSFLDCGEGAETRAADNAGRDEPSLTCGVTLTETIVIPAAADSARLIVHF